MSSVSNKPLAIVIGRNYTTRLALIRAVGMAGCEVVTIQTAKNQRTLNGIDASSKYVVDSKICSEPNTEGLVNLILSYKDERRRVILIPADDFAAATIDSHMDLLKDGFLMPHVNNIQGAIVKLMDKKYQKSLANKVGLKTSDGWLAINNNGVYCIPEGVKYPCFTKPLESYSDGHLKHYLLKCDTESELQTVLNSIAKENHKLPILIEKYNRIDKEYAILGLSLGNKAIIPSVIQMGTSQNGLTATGTIFPISKIPQLREQLVEFMKETQLTGLFDIDMYESDGQLYFNELNVRFGASGFALNHIINLPQILVHYLLSKEEKGLCVDLPVFKEHTLASEKVLRNMYLDGTISFFKYRNFIRKADILSIESNEDVMPQRVFSKKEKHLPFIKAKLLLKNRLKVIK